MGYVKPGTVRHYDHTVSDSQLPSQQERFKTALLFADEMVLLASSPEGLQRQLDALALFYDLRQRSTWVKPRS